MFYIKAIIVNHIRHISSHAIDHGLEQAVRHIMYNLHNPAYFSYTNIYIR